MCEKHCPLISQLKKVQLMNRLVVLLHEEILHFAFWSQSEENVQTDVTEHKDAVVVTGLFVGVPLSKIKGVLIHATPHVRGLTVSPSCPGGGRLDLVISDSATLTYDDLLGFSYQVAKGMEFLASKNVGNKQDCSRICNWWWLNVFVLSSISSFTGKEINSDQNM